MQLSTIGPGYFRTAIIGLRLGKSGIGVMYGVRSTALHTCEIAIDQTRFPHTSLFQVRFSHRRWGGQLRLRQIDLSCIMGRQVASWATRLTAATSILHRIEYQLIQKFPLLGVYLLSKCWYSIQYTSELGLTAGSIHSCCNSECGKLQGCSCTLQKYLWNR